MRFGVARPTAAFVVLIIVAWLAWVIVGVIRHADAQDRYGTVDVPGTAVLTFPRGEAVVSYFERGVELPDDELLEIPSDLQVEVRPADGGRPLRLEDLGLLLEQFVNDSGSGSRAAKFDVPRDGRYRVAADGAAGRRNPEVMFGPSTAFLSTPPGIGLLVGAAVIVLGCFGLGVAALRRAS